MTQIHSILALVRADLGVALVPAAAERLRFEGVAFRPLVLPGPPPRRAGPGLAAGRGRAADRAAGRDPGGAAPA